MHICSILLGVMPIGIAWRNMLSIQRKGTKALRAALVGEAAAVHPSHCGCRSQLCCQGRPEQHVVVWPRKAPEGEAAGP